MEKLTTKVTKINNRFHCRLFENKKVFSEIACKEKQDIRFCMWYMLRWYDKLGGKSLMAAATRNRKEIKPIGKIWYESQLENMKNASIS